ncbi:calcium-binding protein [Falsiroseomonas sp. HW251]|uniref:calcium-binding protein n=1 Tax=Falsiroseomonas sp. HW251 TaxID=3390998 RepID=UPI003D311702
MTITYVNNQASTQQVLSGLNDMLVVGLDGAVTVQSDPAIRIEYVPGATVVVNGLVATESRGITTATASLQPAMSSGVSVEIGEHGLIVAGVGIDLLGQSNTVSNDGIIKASQEGVLMTGLDSTLVNNGRITANNWAATLNGDFASIVNNGTVTSSSNGGVALLGSHADLVNAGMIGAQGNGYAAAVMTANEGSIRNTGTMASQNGQGLFLASDSSGGAPGWIDVFNAGTISGKVNAVEVSDFYGTTTVRLVNAGVLAGTVQLAGGNDLYDGREGKAFGTISMGGGNDVALGGAGAESMDGGAGNDDLEGDGGNDVIVGGAGADTIDGGMGNDTLWGEDGDDAIDAGDGHDLVYGDAGADFLTGGAGIDTLSYVLSNVAVKVNLATGEASGGFAQGDEFTGFERLVGSGFADTLTGSAKSDTIEGGDGADIVKGGAGGDLIRGGAGSDTIEGGAGRDVLFGGDGADLFRYRALGDSKVDPTARDVIRDFQVGVDKIDLALIDASTKAIGNQAFTWIDQADFSKAAGQLHYRTADGNTLVEGDVNGDGAADFSILLNGTLALSATDFML